MSISKARVHELFCYYWPLPVAKLEAMSTDEGNRWFVQLGLYHRAVAKLEEGYVDSACRKLWNDYGPNRLPAAAELARLARDRQEFDQASQVKQRPGLCKQPQWSLDATAARNRRDGDAYVAAMMVPYANASDEVKRFYERKFRESVSDWGRRPANASV